MSPGSYVFLLNTMRKTSVKKQVRNMCVRRACLEVERFWGHKISRFRPQSMPFPICCLQHRRCIERLSWGICILEDSILNFLYCMESEHSPSCIGHIWVMIGWSSKDGTVFPPSRPLHVNQSWTGRRGGKSWHPWSPSFPFSLSRYWLWRIGKGTILRSCR